MKKWGRRLFLARKAEFSDDPGNRVHFVAWNADFLETK
jgi:hypothetical protein